MLSSGRRIPLTIVLKLLSPNNWSIQRMPRAENIGKEPLWSVKKAISVEIKLTTNVARGIFFSILGFI